MMGGDLASVPDRVATTFHPFIEHGQSARFWWGGWKRCRADKDYRLLGSPHLNTAGIPEGNVLAIRRPGDAIHIAGLALEGDYIVGVGNFPNLKTFTVGDVLVIGRPGQGIDKTN